jgi:ABC-type multidrug transport system permease subunit
VLIDWQENIFMCDGKFQQRVYHEIPFFIVGQFIDSLFYTICEIGWSVVWYWVVDFEHNAANFFYFVGMTILSAVSGATFNRFLCFLVPNSSIITTLYCLTALVWAVCKGWLVTYPDLPRFWLWAYWTNPFSYYVMATLERELNESSSGQTLLAQLGFPINGMYYIYPLALITSVLIETVLGYLCFKFLHKGVS